MKHQSNKPKQRQGAAAHPDKPIRYTTLVKQCGKPVLKETLTEQDYITACKENRVVSIHHCDESNRSYAGVGHHLVNVLERIVFPSPLPVAYNTPVHGIDHFFCE